MEAVQFDQLPYLCLRKIFSFLNLDDLSVCRTVNRLFKFYAEETGIQELDVGEMFSCSCNKYFKSWCHSDRPFSHGNSIGLMKFGSLTSSPFKLEQQVKFMRVHLCYRRPEFESKLLSGLQVLHQLVELELDLSASNQEPKTLALPNLKVLHTCYFPLVLKTPKLEVLVCDAIRTGIRTEHPETVKRVECYDLDCLATFKNLQFLVLHCSRAPVDQTFLSNWKHLKELQIDSCGVQFRSSEEAYQSWLVSLMRQRTESKRDELKLYLDEVLLVDKELLETYSAMLERPDLFMFKHHRLLRCDSYPDVVEVNFNELMELNVQLSSDFFDRFPKIFKLNVTAPVERDRFEWFLQNATAVEDLQLTNTSLDQTAFDRLPVLNNRLTGLKVMDSSNLITNFDFILQLEQLEIFETDRELGSLHLAAKAFRQLKKLGNFEFRTGSQPVEIRRLIYRSMKHYNLEFYAPRDNSKASIRPFCERDLKWSELVALYDQKRAALTQPLNNKKAKKKTKRKAKKTKPDRLQ